MMADDIDTIYQEIMSEDINLDEDDLDSVYSEWDEAVNMTASELREWSRNPCSREASVDPHAVIKRNLRLLVRNKDEWTDGDIEDAQRTINFINRMKPNNPDDPRDGPHGCPSEWAISMLNWAYNPFESIPNVPDDEELDPVDEVTVDNNDTQGDITMSDLSDDGDTLEKLADKVAGKLEKRMLSHHNVSQDMAAEFVADMFEADAAEAREALRNVGDREDGMVSKDAMASFLAEALNVDKEMAKHKIEDMSGHKDEEMGAEEEIDSPQFEFAPVPTQVLYDDESRAMERASHLDLDGVHEHTVDGNTHYMAGSTHRDWLEAIGLDSDEMSEQDDEVDQPDEETEEMQEAETHEPSWNDTRQAPWNEPALEDIVGHSNWDELDDQEKSAVADHFIVSKSGFPPENFGDLALPVVDGEGNLVLNALQNAKARAGQVSGLSDEQVEDVKTMISEVANENFEDADFEMQEGMFMYEDGAAVTWESSGGRAYGVVRDRTADDCYDAAIDGDVTVCGEQDNPAYLIEVYDDDEEELTGTMVAHKEQTIQRASFEYDDDATEVEADTVVNSEEDEDNDDDEACEICSVSVEPSTVHQAKKE